MFKISPRLIFAFTISTAFMLGTFVFLTTQKLQPQHRKVASDPSDTPEIAFVRQLVEKYPELNWLAGKVEASPDMVGNASSKTFSQAIFHTSYAEFDRTTLSMSIIQWILDGNYDALTAPQNGASKLSKESFAQLQQMAKTILDTPEKKDAMMVYMAIHDLGKSESLAAKAHALGIESVDHDKLLSEIIKKKPELLPSFHTLPGHMQDVLKQGLNSEFNLAQFIQGENVAASLTGFTSMNPLSRSFYTFHALMDIAGVAGNANTHGSMVLTESTFRNFYLGIEALKQLDHGKTLTQVYGSYFEMQAHLIGLAMNSDADFAVARLAMMIRASDLPTVLKVQKVLMDLPLNTRNLIITELNKTGIDEAATLIYYAPAFLSNAVKSSGMDDGLQRALLVLADIFQASKQQYLARGVRTINIRELAEAVKNGKLNDLGNGPIVIDYLNPYEGKISFRPRELNCLNLLQLMSIVP